MIVLISWSRLVILNQRFGNTGGDACQSHGTDINNHKFLREESIFKLPEALTDEVSDWSSGVFCSSSHIPLV